MNGSEPLPRPAVPAEGALPFGPLTEEECARLRRQIARSVMRVCPSWLRAQAEDIVQTALIRVVEILRAREGNEPLNASYLWRVAYTATVDEIRRLRRRREVPLEEGAGELHGGAGPEQARAGAEIGEGLRECLGRLVESRRAAVTLYLQGHSVPEAGRLLGWTAKRVENLVYRGLADLRRCLASKGLTP